MEELSLNQLIIEYEGVTYGIGNYAIMQDAMGGSRNYSADKFREKNGVDQTSGGFGLCLSGRKPDRG